MFPLYLTSIFVTILFIYFGWIEGSLPSLTAIVANILMVAKFTGQPMLQGLYWTLNLEMLFYLMVTGLFVVKLLKKSVLLAVLALLGALFIGVVGTQVLNLFGSGWGLCFQLATMFVGTVYYRYMTNALSAKAWISVIVLAIAVLFSITYFNLYGKGLPAELGTRSFWPVTNAFFGAYALFSVCFIFRTVSFPSFFLFLGQISYSIYLVQATVLAFTLPHFDNVVLSTLISIGGTILISYFTYHFIEKPSVYFGKQLLKKKSLVPVA